MCLSNMRNSPLSCVMCVYDCIGCEIVKYWDWKLAVYKVEHKF